MANRIDLRTAERILGRSKRTVLRWVSTGKLARDPDGSFDSSEVKLLASRPPDSDEDALADAEEDSSSETRVLMVAQVSMLRSAQSHVEQMVKLMVDMYRGAFDTISGTNQELLKRDTLREEQHTKLLGIVGDILLRTDERKAHEAITLERQKAVTKGVEVLDLASKKILDKLGQAGEAKALFEDILKDPELGEGAIGTLLEVFSDKPEIQKKLQSLLTQVGISAKKEMVAAQ